MREFLQSHQQENPSPGKTIEKQLFAITFESYQQDRTFPKDQYQDLLASHIPRF